MNEKQTSAEYVIPGVPEGEQAMVQIVDLVKQGLKIPIELSIDHQSFSGTRKQMKIGSGALSVRGRLGNDGIVLIQVELVRVSENARVFAASFFKYLSSLGEKVRLVPPLTDSDGPSLWAELRVQASVLSMARASAFLVELNQLDQLAKSLQYQTTTTYSDSDLAKLYRDFPDLDPVLPDQSDPGNLGRSLIDWAKETIDFMTGSASVALSTPYPVMEDFALMLLSTAGREFGKSIGKVIVPSVNAKGLVELSKKAPGILAVPVVSLTLGTSIYEMGNEMRAMLSALSSFAKPALFTGTFEQLQSVFHGGQGGVSDPLTPIVRRVPEIPLEVLVRFAVRTVGRQLGGLNQQSEDELVADVNRSLGDMPAAEQRRILPVIASRVVHTWSHGNTSLIEPATIFAARVSGLSETLAGLNTKPRVQRSPTTQERFTKVLTDNRLLDYLKENLLAQDTALEQLITRLRMEALTRPSHQPIRYCAQGTPGTGKSESAVLIAEQLGIPYVNIDAASIPDYYSAAAQLLGSGRGIVGSYQSGRLEQAAKHHAGVLIEVSDLDHANERVRSGLADLFLQVLETGEAQSAAGAMFSCANVIFAFTMNLPDGMDEGVRKGIGFNQEQSREAITSRVVTEIKKMLSSAFLSRVGTPILFEPLDGSAIAAIAERAIRSAVLAAAGRLHIEVRDVVLEPGVGSRVADSMQTGLMSFGARALLEHGRALAADALLRLNQGTQLPSAETLFVSVDPNGQLRIEVAGKDPRPASL